MNQKDIYAALGLSSDVLAERAKLSNRFKAIAGNLDARFANPYNPREYDKTLLVEVLFALGEDHHSHFRLESLIYKDAKYFRQNVLVMQNIYNLLPQNLKPSLNGLLLAAFSHTVIDTGYSYSNGTFFASLSEETKPLIIDSLVWLEKLPDSKERFSNAWEHFFRHKYSDSLTNAYSALEGAAKHILGTDKRFDDNETIGRFCAALKLEGDWGKLLGNYCKIAHEYSSRHSGKGQKPRDVIDKELVEFYLYQTGLLLRLISKRFPH